MDAAVNAVDDKEFAIRHFVGNADFQHLADHRLRFLCATEDGEVAGGAVHAVLAHDRVHGGDDVAALAHAAQFGVELGINEPNAGLLFLGQSHLLQMPQSADPQRLTAAGAIGHG